MEKSIYIFSPVKSHVFDNPKSFVKQIAIFIGKKDHARAYEASKQMATAFPRMMISHFLLAKAAFALESYGESFTEANKALELAREKEDKTASAIIASASLFMLGRYTEGYETLERFEDANDERIEKLLMAFSAALGEESAALRHAKALIRLDQPAAKKLISRFLGKEGG